MTRSDRESYAERAARPAAEPRRVERERRQEPRRLRLHRLQRLQPLLVSEEMLVAMECGPMHWQRSGRR